MVMASFGGARLGGCWLGSFRRALEGCGPPRRRLPLIAAVAFAASPRWFDAFLGRQARAWLAKMCLSTPTSVPKSSMDPQSTRQLAASSWLSNTRTRGKVQRSSPRFSCLLLKFLGVREGCPQPQRPKPDAPESICYFVLGGDCPSIFGLKNINLSKQKSSRKPGCISRARNTSK